MTKFSMTMVMLVGASAIAFAGPNDTKTPAAGAPKADMPATGQMDMTPPKEIADMGKTMAGTWTCKGQGMGMDMKMADMTGKMTSKLEMSNSWIHDTFDAKMGKTPFHMESYTTYDAKTKTWNQVMVEMGGGWSTGTSTGMTANKMDWELKTHSPMMGEGMFRDHMDMTDAKAGPKMWGEMSQDGKTWTKVYEMTCKKG